MDFTQESVNLLSLFWQFGLLALAISAITSVLKKGIEFLVLSNPNVPLDKKSLFWRDVFLPIAPIVNGALFGYFIKSFPYPPVINDISSRVLFGLVAGMFSGVIYRMLKKFILARTGIEDDEKSVAVITTETKTEIKVDHPVEPSDVKVESDTEINKDVDPPQLS